LLSLEIISVVPVIMVILFARPTGPGEVRAG